MIPLQPPAASSIADDVDQLYLVLTGITLFFTVLIFSIIFYFMMKYRRRSEDETPVETHTPMALELAWTIIPSLICVVLFVWSVELYTSQCAAACVVDGNLCHRQAVDVAPAASRGAARN